MTEQKFLQVFSVCLPYWEAQVGRQSDGQCHVQPHEWKLPEEPEVRRFYLQAVVRYTRYNPFTIVTSVWCGRFLDVSNERGIAEMLHLDERTMRRLSDAIWHRKGYDHHLRQRLFDICGITDLRSLEPTTR